MRATPMLPENGSVNQRFPSGPVVIEPLSPVDEVSVNSVRVPPVVRRPTVGGSEKMSANHTFPSGPVPMLGLAPRANTNGVITPAGVIRPRPPPAENQRLPSGPAVMPPGDVRPARSGNSVITPVGVILPIWPPPSVKPEVPVRARCNARWSTKQREHSKLRDHPRWSDPTDAPTIGEWNTHLSEPYIAVAASCDSARKAVRRSQSKFGYHTTSCHPADFVIAIFGEPEVSIRPTSDLIELT